MLILMSRYLLKLYMKPARWCQFIFYLILSSLKKAKLHIIKKLTKY